MRDEQFIPLTGSWDPLLRRLIYVVLSLTLFVLLLAGAFQFLMLQYENQSVGFLQAIQKIIETLTTTGFGGYAPWDHPVMNAFIIFTNLAGVIIMFMLFPLFFIPLMIRAFSPEPPRSVSLSDHVVICGHSEIDESLME